MMTPIPEVPPLGFGCGNLNARRGRENGLRVLATALDVGFTYFDTARLYGEGTSEGLLGEALAGRRDKVIITSKAGILPPAPPFVHRWMRRIGTRVNKISPLKMPVPPPAEPLFGQFEPHDILSSVHVSMRELRTDYLDVLLLHECTLEDLERPSLQTLLDSLLSSGKIRTWGAAPAASEAERIAVHARPPILQLADDLWPQIARCLAGHSTYAVTHSVLAQRIRPVIDRITSDQDFALRWSHATGLDYEDDNGVAQILLASAQTRNQSGTVLFSSSRCFSVVDCAALLQGPRFTEQKIASAMQLVSECTMPA